MAVKLCVLMTAHIQSKHHESWLLTWHFAEHIINCNFMSSVLKVVSTFTTSSSSESLWERRQHHHHLLSQPRTWIRHRKLHIQPSSVCEKFDVKNFLHPAVRWEIINIFRIILTYEQCGKVMECDLNNFNWMNMSCGDREIYCQIWRQKTLDEGKMVRNIFVILSRKVDTFNVRQSESWYGFWDENVQHEIDSFVRSRNSQNSINEYFRRCAITAHSQHLHCNGT